MILTCPACATSYFIPDDAVGANGRKVRCQSCGEVWRAASDEPLELNVAPPVAAPAAEPVDAVDPAPASAAAPEAASLAETPAPELPRAFRARAEQQRKFRRAAAHGVAWAGLAGVFIGLLVCAFLFRTEIVKAVPRAASAYAMAGVTVNVVGLDFEAVSARPAPGAPGMVVVSGAVRNLRDVEIVAPPVRISLLDDRGSELGVKIVRIDAAPVLPGKVQGFAALLPNPGGKAAGMNVDFVLEPVAQPAAAQPARPKTTGAPTRLAPQSPPDASPDEGAPGGLRSAVAPGVVGRAAASPLEAHPVAALDSGRGLAVSASNHG